ncbi:NADH-quinone oxidoreductase subunit NuoN [Plasticicumulans sp.]|uniref:NADH-quinone oxidoreductase subunit NuoN n=1 Tax=Plasticicumulans sp. TaxID=2307179 RepID=UPI002CB4066E|nr:NADH-quinone oxidoreductase subunit NuoN [Plasticicumulans sp.]MBS0602083.1 NADH-quinone oxidoreductase subunit NuoN [Pseudomonadota bacterium]HMV38305.1 NADH-quinone oxidoreductase subunit NuoN [Plasticicumulans sp.]HMW28411.1 NADH-quinone oxidoreductase subunit NuoN [Plasticicumulans sp.]HMW41599.1 NADH-quinone oxidoreductase subunit NuoN [Plasticicumulans sp.]HMX52396.1 NADH-quinone oxidoreductase subunit NuoN [Plasticicumulans sp.]
MTFVPPDLMPALPEIFVATMACLVLVIDVYLPEARRTTTLWLSIATLLFAALLTLATAPEARVPGFHGHFVRDAMGDVLKIGVYLSMAAALLYSRDYLRNRTLFKGEYYVLALFAVLGMMVMISAASFLTVYLGLELLSLSLYALVAFDREDGRCSESAMKYFVLGALASGMLLYGISMMYGATGSLNLASVAQAIAGKGDKTLVLIFGTAFLVVGLAFKLGAVPFHMWLPDVYQGAPTSVTMIVASAPKLAAFALTMRILVEGVAPLGADWQQMLMVLAALSIAAGNVIAIAQTNIKRLLAYSTISHVGFILLGFVAGTAEGYAASMFYALTYVLMTVGSFGLLILCGRAGVEIENISDLKGLNDRSPWLAFMMLVLMMSTAGIPFLVGFYAKFAVLQAVVAQGFVGLAIFAVILSVIGAFYYLRVVKVMYFDKAEDDTTLSVSADAQVLMGANGLAVMLLGVYPSGLMALCSAAIH